MRAFIKNLFRIAGGAIAIGIILVLVAIGMDNKVYTKWHRMDLNLGDGYTLWNNEDVSNGGQTDNNQAGGKVVASANASEEINTNKNYPVTYQNVKSLDFHIIAGKLFIKEGKEFSLDVNEKGSKRITSEVNNGVWTLQENSSKAENYDNDNNFSIFGINIDLNDSGNNNYTEVYVTIPKDFSADDISLSVGAGAIKADTLSANTGKIQVGAGSCSIDELKIKENSSFQVDAGMLQIDKGTINNAGMTCAAGKIKFRDGIINNGDINCTAGGIDITGSITGDSTVSTSVGKIDLNLEGKEKDYNYTIDCNVGSLTINGTKYNGVNKHITQQNAAPNNMSLNCDIGSITMNID